jgi:hypothetical protein
VVFWRLAWRPVVSCAAGDYGPTREARRRLQNGDSLR